MHSLQLMKRKSLMVSFGLLATVCPLSAATLTALTTFGGGDGWLAPADYGGGATATSNTERMFAYNPATGNLVLVSRNAGNAVRTYNGTTGAFVATLAAPTVTYVSAALNITAVGVSTDGQIFVTNLADGSNGTAANRVLSVYSWASESTPSASVVTTTHTLPTGLRLGDSMDAIGSGTNAKIVMGYNATVAATPGGDGFAIIPVTSLTGGNFTPTTVDPTTGSIDGAFRLGASFVDADTVLGSVPSTFRIADFSGSAASNVTTITGLQSTAERQADIIDIGGVSYLATVDSSAGTNVSRNTVRVYSLSGAVATFLASANLIGAGVSTGNNTGDVEWGAVSGDMATLYSLTTNNGIQAFTFQVPEPSSTLLGLVGLGLLLRRRRK